MAQYEHQKDPRNGELRFRLKKLRRLFQQGLWVSEGIALIIAGWMGAVWFAWHVMAFLHDVE